ncbi:type II toxin-antitoxin system PemK/MazF family toxin [Acaryochloris sp. 'Moss Beach']|uniref:type II toxin-antitoxin system PemK/MazF family toxin n=1 Tax=Acaryochloris sp. 'Moss Beach' TaxID=2740837 RepID=UPI001F15E8C3|nr:type II toxin-antitoxin system PemK/MazF family toxin [Acaryochloris sp. 'Moss Beach']UJB69395.1 type II toxin-antitoxin system PemK/MazF family toxin [Acaryochloris sp. 'Moss Beach']
MNGGEVWWINFDPSVDGEIKKERPAIIVSNNAANRNLNRVQVVPITRNVSRLYPSEALVTLHGRQGKAMADQLAAVSKQRIRKKAGEISLEEMTAVELAVRMQLGLS